ncbi:hypothetical protein T440DRAFT_471883 [Plenodomus tracheiphilus IPT5]|uniref:Uncharacterized protein n=1 Tax=Plenodomus tracheiphilus IPT5 TaxID=1408161 RepID=A0A6A7ATQ3_9PLEO|nr:hypothetical protein T440DRAFT_471883 [Plenodomus tracheiphilus IPT5]
MILSLKICSLDLESISSFHTLEDESQTRSDCIERVVPEAHQLRKIDMYIECTFAAISCLLVTGVLNSEGCAENHIVAGHWCAVLQELVQQIFAYEKNILSASMQVSTLYPNSRGESASGILRDPWFPTQLVGMAVSKDSPERRRIVKMKVKG